MESTNAIPTSLKVQTVSVMITSATVTPTYIVVIRNILREIRREVSVNPPALLKIKAASVMLNNISTAKTYIPIIRNILGEARTDVARNQPIGQPA